MTEHPRGRCACGAWMPKGSEQGGILCNNCPVAYTPEDLRMNGFEWTGGEWVHA